MVKSSTLIKYMDLFGTTCTFYSEKMPKFYTLTGGIFSILSILICLLIFFIFSLDDIKRKFPNTTNSFIPSEGYRKIKFGKEKIWIPWRIVDYNNNEFVNHTGILYPIIYYYSGVKDKKTKEYNLTEEILNYRLCNETQMVDEKNRYQITVPLNELYCIDMEDLDMGGSWITEFINYVEFDLYYCEDGINYNENNPKCSSFKKIIDFIGENNSLQIEFYYPVVQFQSTNKTYPLIGIYRNHFYHISRYGNKIDRIFLQENVLTDDSGWILNKEINSSYWGLNSITGDTYYNGNDRDLMNEGSNSRAYSFNIYLEPGIIHYKRNYKKIYIIFSDFFPVAYVVFIIIKNISKLFKKAENNKRMIELLFENLKEKPNIFEENLQMLRAKNNNVSNYLNFNFNSLNRKYNDNNYLKRPKFGIEQIQVSDINKSHRSSLVLNNKNNLDSNNGIYKLYGNNKILSNKKNRSRFYEKHKKSFSINATNQNLMINGQNNGVYEKKINENFILPLTQGVKLIKQKLFPYKYYLCSVFVRNLNITKKNCVFSSRFTKVYAFLCQLFDITTYLSFQREFNALKQIFNEKSVNIIEKNKKININSNSFIRDINNCIDENKFYILAQGIKQ